jgi:glycosyltransferase involved in cell wall biosynthesis
MNIALITYQADIDPVGVGVNVQNLVENIIELDKDNTYYLLHFNKTDNPIYSRNEILYRHFKHLPVMFSDSWYLRRNSHQFDIVHRFAPGGFLFKTHSKIVTTVNDLFLYKTYPFNKKIKLYLGRSLNRLSIMKADAVISISQFTKQEVVKTFKLDETKVHVVYCAPNHMVRRIDENQEILKSHYGINHKYILFVSTIEPRKNLLSLVKVFEALKEQHSIEESLVVVGKKGWDYQKILKYIEKSKYKDDIHLIGFVPTSHLGSFYSNASLFVYPSFMEGFGMPPLEAMKCGCPTLTSNTSSLPEVVRNPEMMFNPKDLSEITAKCLKVLKDPSARQDNIQKGATNIEKFNWKSSARKIIDIYNSLGNNLY